MSLSPLDGAPSRHPPQASARTACRPSAQGWPAWLLLPALGWLFLIAPPAAAQTAALSLSLPSSVTAGVDFTLTAVGLDAAGNVVPDFALSSAAALSVDSPAGATLSMPTPVGSAASLRVRVLRAEDNTPLTLRLSDSGLVATATALVAVVATELSFEFIVSASTRNTPINPHHWSYAGPLILKPPVVLYVGEDAATVTAKAVDAEGNEDADAQLGQVSATVAALDGASMPTFTLVATTPVGSIRFTKGDDLSTMRLSGVTPQGLVGATTFAINVLASSLFVTMPARFAINVHFPFDVLATDAYGNVDFDVLGTPQNACATAGSSCSADDLSDQSRSWVHTVGYPGLKLTLRNLYGVGARHYMNVFGVGSDPAYVTPQTFYNNRILLHTQFWPAPQPITNEVHGVSLFKAFEDPDGKIVRISHLLFPSYLELALSTTTVQLDSSFTISVRALDSAGVSAPFFSLEDPSVTQAAGSVSAGSAMPTVLYHHPGDDPGFDQVAVDAAPLPDTDNRLTVRLLGFEDQSTLTLQVRSHTWSGTTVELRVFVPSVVATRLALTAPPVVASGTSFTLVVRAENALGEEDVDYALSSMAAVSASAGTLEQSRSGAGVSLSLSGVADGATVTLTVSDGALTGTVELTVDVEATGLALTAPPVVVSGTSFTLAVRAENALGELDVDYALSSLAAVTASAGTLAEQSRSGAGVMVVLTGVADGDVATLAVDDGALSGSASVMVDVVATRLALTVPPVVVSGTSFTLAVRAENALGELDVDYALSSLAAVTASAGTLAEQSRSGAGVSLSLSGVADGTTVALTVADGLLSGSVELTVDVEARRLSLTAPLVVVSGTSFTLAVRAENALGALDVDYALSSMAAVTASAGTLAEQSRSGSSVELSLSGVADGTTVELTVLDGERGGTVELTVDVAATGLALTAPLVVVSGTSFTLASCALRTRSASWMWTTRCR